MKFSKKIAAALLAGMVAGVSVSTAALAGWQQSGNQWRYQKDNGTGYCTNSWENINGCWYHFNSQGDMQTGWILDGNCWYYCGTDGAMKTGWIWDGSHWYYCNGSGVMQTGWLELGGTRYFLNNNGAMQTGIIQIDGTNYRFDTDGALIGENVGGFAEAAYTSAGVQKELVDPVKDGTTVRVTISEGKNAGQIAELLEENGVCRKEDFLKALNSYQTQTDIFQEFCGNPNLYYQLEGCLFPDTYEFYRYEDPENVIRKMLINFDSRLDESLRQRMESKGLTLVETLTLASMIQKEAAKPEDMAKVSAVFWNRLQNASVYPKLQSNPTKDYMNQQILAGLGYGNSAVNPASYDTYQTNGLPAGPICNPGLEAITAALYPDENCDAYFFCTDKTGTFYFASTYAEHQKNVETANQVNASLSAE
ncbi:MAG: endolytic transglycosylase MltG [Candidatus Merdivicinus sp.]